MVSIATGVLCAVCAVTSYLVAAKFKSYVRQPGVELRADAGAANYYALTTDALSDHHHHYYAKRKGSWRAADVRE